MMPNDGDAIAASPFPILAELQIKEDLRIQDSFNNWLDWYLKKETAHEAIVDILNFLVSASGCKSRITLDMLRSKQYTDVIGQLTIDFGEESGEYPLTSSIAATKKVKLNLSYFMTYFVEKIKNSVIYNHELMDSVLGFLTQLADSQVRAFRHTSTFAVMKFLTALEKVILETEESRHATDQQLQVEEGRETVNETRMAVLKSNITELDQNLEELRNIWEFAFKGVFYHRYRDSFADIRALCIEELGEWMRLKDVQFVDDSYLKYIGWLLFDKSSAVRTECLRALHPLFDRPNLLPKLELFTEKFKKRLVQMLTDVDDNVAVLAMKIVGAMNERYSHVLTEEDKETIYELCYASNRPLAQASAEFLERTIQAMHDGKPKKTKTSTGKVRNKVAPVLLDIVQFFIESEVHKHTAYLVDSMIEVNEVLSAWDAYTDLLLNDAGPEEEPLDARSEAVLIDLLACSVRQTATGQQPPVRRSAPRKLSAKEKRTMEQECKHMTARLLPALSALLLKFAADEKNTTHLLEIVQHFNLYSCSEARVQSQLESLTEMIQLVLAKHDNEDTLRAASRALECIAAAGGNKGALAVQLVGKVLDEFVHQFISALDRFVVSDGVFAEDSSVTESAPDEKTEFNLKVAFKRMSIIICYNDMTGRGLFKRSLDILAEAHQEEQLAIPESILTSAQSVCYHEVIWSLMRAKDKEVEQAAIAELIEMRDTYFTSIAPLITRSDIPDMAARCFTSACDCLLFFSSELAKREPHLSSAVVELDDTLKTALQSFFEENVLSYDAAADYDNSEDVAANEQRLKEVFNHRCYMTGYMKLILTGIIPLKEASGILQYYIKTRCFQEQFKWFVTKLREVDRERCVELMFTTLVRLYEDYLYRRRGDVDKDSSDFREIKDLARRFSMLFGIDSERVRPVANTFHQLAFRYALGPRLDAPTQERVPFLDVVSDFTVKTVRRDKDAILLFLDTKLLTSIEKSSNVYKLLVDYRTLVSSSMLDAGEASDMPRRRRGRPGKKARLAQAVDATPMNAVNVAPPDNMSTPSIRQSADAPSSTAGDAASLAAPSEPL